MRAGFCTEQSLDISLVQFHQLPRTKRHRTASAKGSHCALFSTQIANQDSQRKMTPMQDLVYMDRPLIVSPDRL